MITDATLMECGMVFLLNLSADELSSFSFSNATKQQLEAALSTDSKVFSHDIYSQCRNIGLGHVKALSLARRFADKKFEDLRYVTDEAMMSCDNIGEKTVQVIREILKPVKSTTDVYDKKDFRSITDGRLALYDTLIPSKIVNVLNANKIAYADELRMLDKCDISGIQKRYVDAFYKAYVNKCGNIKFVDYIDNMLDITITSLRISFNNYIRHRGANDNNCLEAKRYYAVSFINEIIFKLNINTYDLFEFYDGNGDECIRYMHKAFKNKNFDVSRELMDNFINDTVNAAKYISDWVKRANI